MDLQEQFEAWMTKEGLGHLLGTRGNAFDDTLDYLSAGTQHRWIGYQAAAKERGAEK